MYLANASQIRQADAIMISNFHFPGLELMENAGRKSAAFLLQKFPGASLYLVLAGPGNNGGDGLVIARYLSGAGKKVQVLLAKEPEKFNGDALENFKRLENLPLSIFIWGNEKTVKILSGLPAGTILIDALLGTGIIDQLRSPFEEIISFFKERNHPVVAIDLPSGLNADTGHVLNAPLKAQYTLTFHLPKLCHCIYPAAEYCGEVVVLDIGIQPEINQGLNLKRELTEPAHILKWFQQRGTNTHKGNFGHTLLAGGSKDMAGAISLSSRAALAVGAGLSSAFIPGSVRCAFFQMGAEVMTLSQGMDTQEYLSGEHAENFLHAAKNKNAIAIGPGMGTGNSSAAFLENILPGIQVPLVLDADALNLLSANPSFWKLLPAQTILTPHPGEMKRLTGRLDVQEFRLEVAEEMTRTKNVTVILKGANTIIALPDGKTFVNSSGNPGMATAGAGDVLTGILTGLLAQGYPIEQAAPMGVYLHGLAGDLAAEINSEAGVTAEKILGQLGPALQLVLEGKAQTILRAH